MATNFPTSLDSYTDVADGDTIQISTTNNQQDAIEALEAKVGIDSSAVTSSHDYKIGAIETILGSASTADLTKLHGVTATAEELNKLDADTLTVGDLLTKGAGGMDVIAAVAATQYLKSAGTSTVPAYGKLSLSDTGVSIGALSLASNEVTVTTGFEPSAIIFVGKHDSAHVICVGFDDGTNHTCIGVGESYAGITSNSVNTSISKGYVTSKSATGFTFTWSARDVSDDVIYLALP